MKIKDLVGVPLSNVVADTIPGGEILWYYLSGVKSGAIEMVVASKGAISYIDWSWSYGITTFGKFNTTDVLYNAIAARSFRFYSIDEYFNWRNPQVTRIGKLGADEKTMRKFYGLDYVFTSKYSKGMGYRNGIILLTTPKDKRVLHEVSTIGDEYTTVCGESWSPPSTPVEFFNHLPCLTNTSQMKKCEECWK